MGTTVPRGQPLSGTLYEETSRQADNKPGWSTWQLLSDRWIMWGPMGHTDHQVT